MNIISEKKNARITLACPLPNESFYLACSGGIDSMVALDFLQRGGRKPKIIYFNHGTEHGAEAQKFVENKCVSFGLDLFIRTVVLEKDPRKSQEEYWRNERYNVFHNLNAPVITAHHLNDAIETWIFSSFHGQGKLIPVTNKNVIRPFLLTDKDSIEEWAANHDVTWIDDPSNGSRKYMRNIIRHDIVKHALTINPGMHKMLRKKYKGI